MRWRALTRCRLLARALINCSINGRLGKVGRGYPVWSLAVRACQVGVLVRALDRLNLLGRCAFGSLLPATSKASRLVPKPATHPYGARVDWAWRWGRGGTGRRRFWAVQGHAM
jgi:hypothetical protein